MTALDKTLLVLWVVPVALQGILTAWMWIRKLYREFPIFFSYTAYHAVRDWVLLYLDRHSKIAYFYSYWAMDLVSALLGLAVIWEVYDLVLRPYAALRQLGTLLFRWAGAMLIVLAVIAAASAEGNEASSIIAGILALERGIRIVQGGLLLLLFGCASFLGLSWRQYVLGIALGFALFVSVELVVVTMRVHVGTPGNLAYQLLKPAAYNCAVFVWLVYLWQPVPAAKRVPPSGKFDLAAWNHALSEFLTR